MSNTVRLLWLPEALEDLDRLLQFLYQVNTEAASKAARAILRGSQHLVINPRIGRPMSDRATYRELFTPFGAGAYILRYQLQDESTVVIVRVWHNRENRLSDRIK